ncbi:MAG: hypothetical protein JSV99_04400 [Planctomycetota bacterium]|nr:MAG: hypothetical protein JSV99_04400 [Planctomycetota bacterium]
MSALTNRQKQLLLDYCIGLTSEEEASEAKRLISSNKQAGEIQSKIKAALAPLDTLEPEPCPDYLADGTVWRLSNFARSSQLRLQQLLASEQAKSATTKSRLWRKIGEVATAAAAIVFVAGVIIAPLNFARQKSWEQLCQMQLWQIGQGIHNYSADHDGKMPAVATTRGSPWWKVGYQGEENHSNTRHIWLLPKGGYVEVSDFICAGKRHGRVTQLEQSQVKSYNDFPARRYVSYSFRIRCKKSANRVLTPTVLIADLNPLFERLPDNYSSPLNIRLNDKLFALNSINHSRRGQNVLFCDGSTKFVKIRRIGIAEDDIFTLNGTDIYEGTEVPSCETDAFLAP